MTTTPWALGATGKLRGYLRRQRKSSFESAEQIACISGGLHQGLSHALLRHFTLQRDHCSVLFGFHVMDEISSFLDGHHFPRAGVAELNAAK